MTRGLLVASFGTTHQNAYERNVLPVERALAAAFPDAITVRAYTSFMVRRALAKRGVEVDGVQEALDRLADRGCTDVLVVSTHLLPGDEYSKLVHLAHQRAGCFERLSFSRPLLSDHTDYQAVLRILASKIELGPAEALVCVGHGSEHYSNSIYAAMAWQAHLIGYDRLVIGTIEAYPGFDEALSQVRAGDFERVCLTPLLLVAGDHAVNDICGYGPDSWQSRFVAAGLSTRAVLKGLGEYPEVCKLYCQHAIRALEKE